MKSEQKRSKPLSRPMMLSGPKMQLKNEEITCYSNATWNAMFLSPSFQRWSIEQPTDSTDNTAVNALTQIIRQARETPSVTMDFECIVEFIPKDSDTHQDAEECLLKWLETMRKNAHGETLDSLMIGCREEHKCTECNKVNYEKKWEHDFFSSLFITMRTDTKSTNVLFKKRIQLVFIAMDAKRNNFTQTPFFGNQPMGIRTQSSWEW